MLRSKVLEDVLEDENQDLIKYNKSAEWGVLTSVHVVLIEHTQNTKHFIYAI